MQIITDDNPAKKAGMHLSTSLLRYKTRPVLLLVSGGSALNILDYVAPDSLGGHITLSTLDERFSVDPLHNNYAQLQQSNFYRCAKAAGVKCIPTTVTEEDKLQPFVEKIEAAWHTWRTAFPDGVVLATMGIGADGHVAGLLPGQEVAMRASGWVLGYEVPVSVNPYTRRVTATYDFLREEVDEVVGYAVGAKKLPYLQHLHENNAVLAQLPMSVIAEMKWVTFFTDQTVG